MTKSSKKFEKRASTSVGSTSGRGDRAQGERESPAASSKRAEPVKKGLHGVPGSKNDSRRCTATARRTSERCKRAAIKGGTVCTTHGGRLPQVKKKAQVRLLEAADPVAAELVRIALDKDTDDAVKVRAITAVLDRAGLSAGVKVEISGELSKFEQIQLDVFGIDMVDGKPVARTPQGGVNRAELVGDDRRALPTSGGGGGEFDEQEDYDLRQEIDQDDDVPRIRSTGPVVVGQVVDNDPPDAAYGGTR